VTGDEQLTRAAHMEVVLENLAELGRRVGVEFFALPEEDVAELMTEWLVLAEVAGGRSDRDRSVAAALYTFWQQGNRDRCEPDNRAEERA
jgi:hypothetical protein